MRLFLIVFILSLVGLLGVSIVAQPRYVRADQFSSYAELTAAPIIDAGIRPFQPFSAFDIAGEWIVRRLMIRDPAQRLLQTALLSREKVAEFSESSLRNRVVVSQLENMMQEMTRDLPLVDNNHPRKEEVLMFLGITARQNVIDLEERTSQQPDDEILARSLAAVNMFEAVVLAENATYLGQKFDFLMNPDELTEPSDNLPEEINR